MGAEVTTLQMNINPPKGTIDWIEPPGPNSNQVNHYFKAHNNDGEAYFFILHPAGACNRHCTTLINAMAQQKEITGGYDPFMTSQFTHNNETHTHIRVTELQLA